MVQQSLHSIVSGGWLAVQTCIGCTTLSMLSIVSASLCKASAAQGLFRRPEWREAVKVPLALVPSGSGNALAASTGLWTPATAAHAVVKGLTRPIDVVSVLQPPGHVFARESRCRLLKPSPLPNPRLPSCDTSGRLT